MEHQVVVTTQPVAYPGTQPNNSLILDALGGVRRRIVEPLVNAGVDALNDEVRRQANGYGNSGRDGYGEEKDDEKCCGVFPREICKGLGWAVGIIGVITVCAVYCCKLAEKEESSSRGESMPLTQNNPGPSREQINCYQQTSHDNNFYRK
jgi:hypothetical protein